MEIDKVDLKIIEELYHGEKPLTTTDLAKRALEPDGRSDLIKCNSLITSKLKKLNNYNILDKEDMNGKNIYYVDHKDLLSTEGELEFNYNLEEKEETKKTHLDNIIFLPKDKGIYVISFLPEE